MGWHKGQTVWTLKNGGSPKRATLLNGAWMVQGEKGNKYCVSNIYATEEEARKAMKYRIEKAQENIIKGLRKKLERINEDN